MERSFHSPLGTKSPFSPRSRQSLSSQRQIGPPTFRKLSRLSGSVKSAQGVQIILKSNQNYVERFGQPLPVLVTEALTFAERNIVVSARISNCGYAWVVCGRRLLVWQYKQNVQPGTPLRKQNTSTQCYELQLPQSDLAHRAELVSVFIPNGLHTPSCIAVSPEGVVRYWPAVIHEGVAIEQVVDLHGQECDSLTDIGNLGCILATTTCSVVLVQPHFTAGRHNLSCRTLRTPTGWLGGIGKKMSSFIFGPMSTEQSAETRLVRVLSVPEDENVWIVYVLAGHSLQKWRMSNSEPEHLLFVTELNRFVRDGFHATVWENCGGDQTETDTWLLDIQSDKDNLIILAAAVNMHVSPQVHYAMVSVQTNSANAPSNIRDFLVLKMNSLYREDNPAESLSYRFLLCGMSAYLYNQRHITIIKPQEEPDILEFPSPQDFLLGGSICVNTPIFFSRNHGLIAVFNNEMNTDLNVSMVSLNNTHIESSINESAIGNLSVYNLDADEIYHAFKDTVSQMKAAFIYHMKKQQAACQDIIQELFLSEGTSIAGVDNTLDKVVNEISQELLDDRPAGDPRWNPKNNISIGGSYSMQILNQLQDKQRALSLFVRFLHDSELWNRLAAITIRGTILTTVHVLGECSEKLVASIALKESTNNAVLEKAIDRAINDNEIEPESALTKHDIFFSRVSKMYKALQELVYICEDAAHSDLHPTKVAKLIKECNDLLLSVLKAVLNNRQQNIDNFAPQQSALALAPDYLPWTAAVGPHGLHDILTLQQSLTLNYGARVAGDNFLRNALYDQLVSLVDFILDAYKSHLESIRDTNRENVLFKQYQVDRHKLISPLVTDKQWEKAAVLAEKYLDFETLIKICEATNNQQRLENYMEKFNSEGFSEFVYTWYLQANQPGKLINRCRTIQKTKNLQKLTNFLADHPSLSWLQNIFDKKFGNAADILRQLGEQEHELIIRQKTIFSLSKLAKLAAADAMDTNLFMDHVNSRLELISFQEDVPDYVLQHYGYDTLKPPVIPPKDLIHLYICGDFKEANEIEFKKALDLLEFVKDDELKCELTLDVWKAAILRDSWLSASVNSPMEILQNTLFFKLADLALCLGADPQSLLPPIDMLMELPELAELVENKNFQYLVRAGYEHVYKSQI